jgi:hypothetical protein
MDTTDRRLRVAEFWDTGYAPPLHCALSHDECSPIAHQTTASFRFGPKGIPVTALSAVLHELEDYANQCATPLDAPSLMSDIAHALRLCVRV